MVVGHIIADFPVISTTKNINYSLNKQFPKGSAESDYKKEPSSWHKGLGLGPFKGIVFRLSCLLFGISGFPLDDIFLSPSSKHMSKDLGQGCNYRGC